MMRRKSVAMAMPGTDICATSAPITQSANSTVASASTAPMAVTAIHSAASRAGAQPASCQLLCMGMRTAGTLSFCMGLSGRNVAVWAARKLSAGSEAPSTLAIATSRTKPSALPSNAPAASFATMR
jgi:hypothetical protein